MDAWRSWAVEDLLPFSPRAYWRLFALENEAVWPVQPLLLAAGLLLLTVLARGWRPPARWLALPLAAAWAWTGWQFVALGYGSLNWAAPALAWGFYMQALLLAALGLSGRLALLRRGRAARPGLALFAAGLLVWPALAALDGRSWREAEVAALAPDPTAIATLGLLALAPRHGWTALLQAIPALWLGLSGLTLLTMGAWQGWAALAAGLAGLAAWSAGGRD